MKRLAPTAMLLLAVIGISPALGQSEEGASAAKPSVDFQPAVVKALDTVIVPDYEALATRADEEVQAFEVLCEGADTDHLTAARNSFRDLVAAWSRVEMYRFGPVRDENRYERLFFWPDPRGRGLKQVQAILAGEDPDATDITMLRDKSVAVQGLFALEYVLFGAGSDALGGGSAGTYRCRYGQAVAGAIAETARQVSDEWASETGYPAVMRDAGTGNPVYRSHGEVVQELLKSARDQLQLDQQLKLAASIGKTPDEAKPKLAPFWQSNLTIPSIRANLDAVGALMGPDGIGAILPGDTNWQSGSLAFALKNADKALGTVEDTGEPWETLVTEPENRKLLTYSLIPLGDAVELMEHGYPDAFGLVAGFNSLDGD
jgi:uncharacterized protein